MSRPTRRAGPNIQVPHAAEGAVLHKAGALPVGSEWVTPVTPVGPIEATDGGCEANMGDKKRGKGPTTRKPLDPIKQKGPSNAPPKLTIQRCRSLWGGGLAGRNCSRRWERGARPRHRRGRRPTLAKRTHSPIRCPDLYSLLLPRGEPPPPPPSLVPASEAPPSAQLRPGPPACLLSLPLLRLPGLPFNVPRHP